MVITVIITIKRIGFLHLRHLGAKFKKGLDQSINYSTIQFTSQTTTPSTKK